MQQAERPVANVAPMRFLFCVHQVVPLQMDQLRETLGANVAFERPFARVLPLMDIEMGQLSERLGAYVALVGLFSRVHLLVPLQVAQLREHFLQTWHSCGKCVSFFFSDWFPWP